MSFMNFLKLISFVITHDVTLINGGDMHINNILAFAGSTRINSYNKKLLNTAIRGATEAGAEVTKIDLRDYPLPLYDGDLEALEGIPENAKKLKELFFNHHALLLALPEYNSSFTGVFKNSIDWISRQDFGETPLQCFQGKVACLMSTSPGTFGGMRGLVHARAMLENINVLVMPEQICVPNAMDAFDEYDRLKNDHTNQSVEKLGAKLFNLSQKINGNH
jgi:NAD(P)H-dependent FMN reductase